MLNQRATITSKMQLTIPIKIARKLGVKIGERVDVSEEDGRIIITPMIKLIHELSGSLPMPKEWEGKDLDAIIAESKEEYFNKRYKSKKP